MTDLAPLTEVELQRMERYGFIKVAGALRCPHCHAESLGVGFHDQVDWTVLHREGCAYARLIGEVRRLRKHLAAHHARHDPEPLSGTIEDRAAQISEKMVVMHRATDGWLTTPAAGPCPVCGEPIS